MMNKLLQFLIFSSIIFSSQSSAELTTIEFLKINQEYQGNLKKVNLPIENYESSQNSAVKILMINGGHGSGTYVKIEDRFFIVTAKHVVRGFTVAAVIGKDGEKAIGKVVYRSQRLDLAIISTSKIKNRKPVEIYPSNSRDIKIGEEVIYTGFPSIYRFLSSTGIVSSHFKAQTIIIQAFGWGGSSGSGVIDNRNRLRGVVFAIGQEPKNKNESLKIPNLTWVHVIDQVEMDIIKSKVIKN